MKKIYFILAAALSALSCSTLQPPVLPVAGWADLTPTAVEQKIQAAEAQFKDLRPGVEKGITWLDPVHKTKTPYAIVYLHGFTATRGELAPVPDLLGKTLGANVFYTRLTGAGRTKEAYKDIPPEAWLADAAEALEIGKALGDRVILFGTSTGGPLAVWLASSEQKAAVAAVILCSPNFGLKDGSADLLLSPIGGWLAWLTIGEYRQFKTISPQHAYWWDWQHHSSSLVTMMKVVDFGRHLDFSRLTVPVIQFYNPGDTIVDEARGLKIFEAYGSAKKKLVVTETADVDHHLLAGDVFSPASNAFVVNTAADFLRTALTP